MSLYVQMVPYFVLYAMGSSNAYQTEGRIITDSYGQEPTINYFSFVLYSIGCWLGSLAAVMSIGMYGKLTKSRNERIE